ncbi:phosphoribosyltransferase [Roseomonas sp. USHLN139]|uniref:phosphoribosyltransferase n=1 Tax=Roseomonas sp. USHLN139 TaxID=3081298 RepID=UPI003B02EAE4
MTLQAALSRPPAGDAIAAADAATHHRYATHQAKRNMTLVEAEQLSRHLAVELAARGTPYDVIIGLANGALLPTQVVADQLGIPFHMVKVRRQGSRWIQRLQAIRKLVPVPTRLLSWGPVGLFWYWFQKRYNKLEKSESSFEVPVAGLHVLLIDDCIVSGGSLRYVLDRLHAAGAASVTTGVICWSDDAKAIDPAHAVTPDVYLHRDVHFYPWSGSSPYLTAYEAWLRARGLELWT